MNDKKIIMFDVLNKIKDICQNHLCNIEISKVQSREDTNDLYLLGKWDLAQEIMEEIITKEIIGGYNE